MDSSPISDFLRSDKNTYNFQYVLIDSNSALFTIDGEVDFVINLVTLEVSSSDDFLSEWVSMVNSQKSTHVSQLLSQCVKSYDNFLGIDDLMETPLYTEGQSVFELENDNFDLKFVSRMRISEDDFNNDLLLIAFSFLTPQNTAILGRVSKLWYKLTSDDHVWKNYLTFLLGRVVEQDEIELLNGNTFKLKYQDCDSRIHKAVIWDPDRCSQGVILDTTNKIATFNVQGRAIGIKRPHFTLKIVTKESFLCFGFVNEMEMEKIVGRSNLDIFFDCTLGYLMCSGLHGGELSGLWGGHSSNKNPTTGFSFETGDTVGVFHDIENGEIYMHKNGHLSGSSYGYSWNWVFGELYPIVISQGSGQVELIDTPHKFIPKANYKKIIHKEKTTL